MFSQSALQEFDRPQGAVCLHCVLLMRRSMGGGIFGPLTSCSIKVINATCDLDQIFGKDELGVTEMTSLLHR